MAGGNCGRVFGLLRCAAPAAPSPCAPVLRARVFALAPAERRCLAPLAHPPSAPRPPRAVLCTRARAPAAAAPPPARCLPAAALVALPCAARPLRAARCSLLPAPLHYYPLPSTRARCPITRRSFPLVTLCAQTFAPWRVRLDARASCAGTQRQAAAAMAAGGMPSAGGMPLAGGGGVPGTGCKSGRRQWRAASAGGGGTPSGPG